MFLHSSSISRTRLTSVRRTRIRVPTCLFIAAVFAAAAPVAQVSSPLVISRRANFYNTDYQTLAYLRGASTESDAKAASRFHVLTPDRRYQLPPRICWFQMNHRDQTGEEASRAYAAILVVRILPKRDEADSLYVYRNKNWHRYENGRMITLPQVGSTVDVSCDSFSLRHRTAQFVKDIDDLLGVRWHGTPDGTKMDSFERRALWDITKITQTAYPTNHLSSILSIPHSYFPYCYLIGFTPTKKKESSAPVVFRLNAGGCSGILLRVYVQGAAEPVKNYYFTVSEG